MPLWSYTGRIRPDAAPPTDTLPDDPLPWYTISEIGEGPEYRRGLPFISTGYTALDGVL